MRYKACIFQEREEVAGSLWLEQDYWVRKNCQFQYTCQVSIITYQGKLMQILKISLHQNYIFVLLTALTSVTMESGVYLLSISTSLKTNLFHFV